MIGIAHRAPRRFWILLALLGAGCAGAPPLPDPDLSGMEPQVARLLTDARETLRADPSSEEAWGELGSLYDAHLFTDLAVDCYRRAREIDPTDFRWVYLLAVAREIQGAEVDELAPLFEGAAALDPEYAPLHVRWGDALWRRGHHDEARHELERAIALSPDTAMAHRRLGQLALNEGRVEQAVRHLERAVSIEPRDLAAHANLARALMRIGLDERAEAVRRRSRGLEPLTSLKDPVYAEYVFMRNMNSEAVFERGVAAVQGQAFDQAARDLEVFVERRPEDASAHYWLGTAYQGSGKAQPALDHLLRAVEIDPKLARARRQIGALLVWQGRYAAAVEQYERAAALEPLDADAHYGLGLAYEGLGRRAAAERQFLAAARMAPGHPAAARLKASGR